MLKSLPQKLCWFSAQVHTEFLCHFQVYNTYRQVADQPADVYETLLAECRALGIIGKLICGPLWRILEDQSISFFEMNDYWQILVEKFEQILNTLKCVFCDRRQHLHQ
jgi:hypothetical protein